MNKKNKTSAGKGDAYRPVNKKLFNKNYDEINWLVKKSEKLYSK